METAHYTLYTLREGEAPLVTTYEKCNTLRAELGIHYSSSNNEGFCIEMTPKQAINLANLLLEKVEKAYGKGKRENRTT